MAFLGCQAQGSPRQFCRTALGPYLVLLCTCLFSHGGGFTLRFPGLYLNEVQCETVDGDAWVGQLRWVGSVVASENVVWIDGSEVQGQLQLHTGNGWATVSSSDG